MLVHDTLSADKVALEPRERGRIALYICGPTGFMDLAEKAALKAGVPRERVHVERFTSAEHDGGPAETGAVMTFSVTARIARKEATVQQRAGETILRSVRRAGLSAPSSWQDRTAGNARGLECRLAQ